MKLASWNEVTLDECVIRIYGGGTPSRGNPSYWGGAIFWATVKDMTSKNRDSTVETITRAGVDNSSTQVVKAGEVVVCTRMAPGIAAIFSTEVAINQDLKALEVKPGVDRHFLCRVINSKRSELEMASSGSTVAGLSVADLRGLRFLLPPPHEQEVIAEALSDADGLVESLDALIAKKRDMKQAVMQQLLTGRTRLLGYDDEWTQTTVGQITGCVAGGTPSTAVPAYWGGAIRWMSSGELNLKRVEEVSGRITELGLQQSSAQLVPPWSVLIGLAGQGKTRGTAALNLIELSTNQSIAAVLPSTNHDSKFLYYVMDTKYQLLRDLSDGGGGRGGLNLSLIRGIEILLPPIEEQTAIAAVLWDMDDEIDALVAQREKAGLVKQGMMQELLSGRVRLV
jgi:type I restriction enzyme S subunit